MNKHLFLTAPLTLITIFVLSWVLVGVDEGERDKRQLENLTNFARSQENRFFLQNRGQMAWLSAQPVVGSFLSGEKTDTHGLSAILNQAKGMLDLASITLIDRSARIVASTDTRTIGMNLSDRPGIQSALAGEVSFGFSNGQVSKNRAIWATAPVRVRDQVVGLISFRTAAQQLDKSMVRYPDFYLIGPGGLIFSSATLKEKDTSAWIWDGRHRVNVHDRWFRVARYTVTAVPDYTFVSLAPDDWPWATLIVVDLLVLLALVTGLSFRHQLRLSQERRAEERVRQQRETLLANLLEGIAVLDGRGNLVWANPAFERLAEMAPGHAPPALDDLWDRPGGGPWVDVLAGRRSEVVFEAVLKGRQGGWTPVLAGFAAAGGQFLLSVLDRSERHRSDQMLRQSQKLTVLGQLSGGVAHDLNNMLGVLMGMTDLLKVNLHEQDPLQESVDLMLSTLARAASLAEKMLNFARQTPMVRDPLDVTALLRELRFLARTALPEPIEAVVEAQGEPVWVRGDENLLLSALLNLILNAAEAIDGRGVVTVTGRRAEDGRYAIAVEDQGRGMDKETLSRIFEPFFSTKLDKKGTGLGLSLVQRTVLEHGGTIDIRSQVGEGTRVTVLLPVIEAPSGA